ncbi:hypothetical protein AOA12_20060 [Microbacterium sp. No. 7]|nr:hypothetical protein AOA12_20060 [Microbacterium sp. No. 7]
MAWSTSRRKSQLPPDWDTVIRPAILKRDRHRCQHIRYDTGQKCGAYANQVDHVNQQRNHDHSPSNLQSLCEYHHRVKSSAEGGRAAQKRRRTATKRRHPGLLP